MEARHRCKLCFRNFANGRALGGHMRSHMMKYYAAKKRKEEEFDEHPFDDFQSFYSCSSPSSSSSSSSDEEDGDEEDEVKALLSYELRENPRKTALLVDHDLSFTAAAAASVVLEDGESETETESSKKNPICRRSKRVRKSRISDFNAFGSNGFDFPTKKSKLDCDYSSLSSISDTTPEEHVAHCLIMLSKDNWRREEKIEFPEEDEGNGKNFVDDYREEDYKAIKTTKVRGKYRCDECNKLFKSYQALGGHRASHKKIKPAAPPRPAEKTAAVVEEKIHACPFCHRVFSSGQALGGHKRSHFIGGGAISSNVGNISQVIKQDARTDNGETLNIDLNLPAPVDDDETTSQVAVSAVSDAEFVHPIKW